ncbi:hypothetical protein DLM78_04655 [Leptospira stimsonii]|uniref:Uncharacterized protein n=1 Tax=Leptospira stimsonii TaxID=2202203 RepID=A0A8B3CVK3_9LEPT|nr:hypothetical protein DLM78_04655 [Leptospira stimsonii]
MGTILLKIREATFICPQTRIDCYSQILKVRRNQIVQILFLKTSFPSSSILRKRFEYYQTFKIL